MRAIAVLALLLVSVPAIAGQASGDTSTTDAVAEEASVRSADQTPVSMPGDAPVPMPGDANVRMPGDATVPMPGSVPMPGDEAGVHGAAGLRRAWELRGYVEDTFNIEYRQVPDRVFPLNGARARVNLEGSPSRFVDFGIGVVGTLYSGQTSIGLAQYLPVQEQSTLPRADPATGTPSAETVLIYELENRIYLQEAFVTLVLPRFRLRAGRHKLYAGTGFAYNPTDLFTLKDPLDPTYEVDGHDAVAATLELPANVTLEGTMLFGNRFDVSDYRLGVRAHVAGWDLAAHYTHQVRRPMDWHALTEDYGVFAVSHGVPVSAFERRFRWQLVALELAGELLGVGLHAEGGWAFVEVVGEPGTLGQDAVDHERLLVGLDYTFDSQLYLLVEYMRIGRGRTSSEQIRFNDRMAMFAGEILAIDRDTVFAGASYPLTDLTELAVYAIVGANDPSAIINPWLLVDLFPGVRLSLSVFVPVGDEQGSNGRAGAGGFARLRVSF